MKDLYEFISPPPLKCQHCPQIPVELCVVQGDCLRLISPHKVIGLRKRQHETEIRTVIYIYIYIYIYMSKFVAVGESH